ncbi:phosphatase PAP2 family protein [Candidatus Woesearchaeota archaeon]|nr:phosphatase PAP2 family protein [Candidatus Woesearchaeota archaeon]
MNLTLSMAAYWLSYTAPAIIISVPTAIALIDRKNYGKKLPALYASIALTVIATYFLKFIFRVERTEEKIIPFTGLKDYSFPSSHASTAFAPTAHIHGAMRSIWAAYAILVAASRVYLGEHSLLDVTAGAAIGLIIGSFISKNSRFDIKKDFFEARRQAAHVALGAAIAILLHKGLINAAIMAIVLAAGILISAASRKHDLPLISWALDKFERTENRRKLPGKGAILLAAGATASMLLFPRDVATASIMVLAAGDSVSHITGRFFGKTKQPLSVKLLEGTAAGTCAAFLSALPFVSTAEALASSAIAMAAEAAEIRLGKTIIDDNLIIPLIAGATIMALRALT